MLSFTVFANLQEALSCYQLVQLVVKACDWSALDVTQVQSPPSFQQALFPDYQIITEKKTYKYKYCGERSIVSLWL